MAGWVSYVGIMQRPTHVLCPTGFCPALSRYDECAPESPAQRASRPWLEGIFEGAQAAIQQASRRLTAFIAAKVLLLPSLQPAQ